MKIKSNYSRNLLVIILLVFSTNTFAQLGFGASHSCNINAICDYPWCNQRRSVVLISWMKNNILHTASGALLASERRDGRPYVLTAGHILQLDDQSAISPAEEQHVNTYTFTFNYQSQNCPNPAAPGPTATYTLVGATLRKYLINQSDFALLELNQRPPVNFNVFYSGWNNTKDGEPDNIHMIHHPEADIKKISYSNKKIKKKPAVQKYLWQLKGWTDGTAQDGSSGAPWYDQNKLVVGQQNGAESPSSCIENKESTAGRFWYSWDEGPAYINKMKSILNPNGTGNSYWVSFTGEDACKPSYFITNANDLHTSANVNGMPIGFLNGNPVFSNPAPGTRSYDGVYMASGNIQAISNVNIQSGTSVAFYGNQVILSTGFRAISGCNFTASPQPCLGGCNTGVGKMASNNDEEGLSKLNTDPSLIQTEQDDLDEEIYNDIDKTPIVIMNEMVLFPNPSTGKFTFSTSLDINETYSIKIYDNIGRIVFSQNNISYSSFDIDLSLEAKGVYFINVVKKDITYFRKIILQ